MSRLHKGEHINAHIAPFIRQHKGLHPTVINRRKVYPAAIHKPTAKGQPLRGVVVAADGKHRHLSLRQMIKKIVAQCHSLRRRHRLVINISADQHTVRLLCGNAVNDLLQNIRLILQHRKAVHPLAQVQVG